MSIETYYFDISPKKENQKIIVHDEGEVLATLEIVAVAPSRVTVRVLVDRDELDIYREKMFRREFPLETQLDSSYGSPP